MRGTRAFLLVIVVLLSIVLLILGLGFLGKRSAQYAGSRYGVEAAQARAIALAGLEDARVKLSKDLRFPPPGAVDQLSFTYTETFFDLDGTTPVGSCTVTVLTHHSGAPYRVLQVTSVGVVGPADEPSARRRITAELDISPTVRGGGAVPNPGFFQWMNWTDEGSF
ncbi:MAG: hypothetical protein AB1758_30075 [Candidatus Eremiobacterota bacterium]